MGIESTVFLEVFQFMLKMGDICMYICAYNQVIYFLLCDFGSSPRGHLTLSSLLCPQHLEMSLVQRRCLLTLAK